MASQSVLKEFGYGLGHTILSIGACGAIDWLGNNAIDWPYDDIALGSGMAFGYNFGKDRAGGAAASLAGLLAAISPEVARASAGDFAGAGAYAVIRAVEYTMGAVLGYIYSGWQ